MDRDGEVSGRRSQLLLGYGLSLHFPEQVRRLIGTRFAQHWDGNIEDWNAAPCAAFMCSAVRVAMECGAYIEAVQRTFQPGGTHKRKDFRVFAEHCVTNWRIMEQRNALRSMETGKRTFESHRLVQGFLNKVFDSRFTPGIEHSSSEASTESTDASKADAPDLHGLSIEYIHFSVFEDRDDRLRVTGFIIMVSEHGDDGNGAMQEIFDEKLCFFLKAVVGQITA